MQWTYYKGAGCPRCNHTGFRGRIGIFEFLEVTDTIRELIINGAGTVAVRQKALEEGMETLLASGLSQVKRGVTTVEEVLSVAPLGEMQRSR
jgi:type IV pilus assembly protein PilB